MTITLEQINASQEIDEMIHRLMPAVIRGGLFLEFGIGCDENRLSNIKKIREEMTARGIESPIYGFDSFDEFATIEDGIIHVPGALLESFLDEHIQVASFIHIACDVYSSTKYILDTLKNRILPGTIIVFDEMINVEEQNEFKAFNEFLEEQGRRSQALCHGKYQVAFRIQ